MKIALATLCFGKLHDKLKYIHSLISDPGNGNLIGNRFDSFLRESLALPCTVLESSTYAYEDSISGGIFDFKQPVTIQMFMDLFFAPGGPPSILAWFTLLQKMSEVESVLHYTQCSSCHRQPFNGFRYKCQKCFKYTLCQECFWRGRSSGSHNPDTHPCKEYSYWKSPGQAFSRSLRKSFRCIPAARPEIRFSEEPPVGRRINLSHIVPPSPIPGVHTGLTNGLPSGYVSDSESTLYASFSSRTRSLPRSPPGSRYFEAQDMPPMPIYPPDEEHTLIAGYASKLANLEAVGVNVVPARNALADISQQQEVVSQLEAKNREIMREIARMRKEHMVNEMRVENAMLMGNQDVAIYEELGALRHRKDELEGHLGALHESRKDLLVQLEGLMKLLKKHGNLISAPGSATSSLNRSALNEGMSSHNYNTLPSNLPSTSSAHSDISAISGISMGSTATGPNRDLLVAADSVTNAMSSLVKGLNSGPEGGGSGNRMRSMDINKSLENNLKLNEHQQQQAHQHQNRMKEEPKKKMLPELPVSELEPANEADRLVINPV